MSSKITGNAPPANGGETNQPTADLVNRPAQDEKVYAGGTIVVPVSDADTQETTAKNALLAHAEAAGLSRAEAENFAKHWLDANRQPNGKVYLYKFTPDGLRQLSALEFETVKQSGEWSDTLDPIRHYRIIDDLNDSQPIRINTIEERVTIETFGDAANALEPDALCDFTSNKPLTATTRSGSTKLTKSSISPNCAVSKFKVWQQTKTAKPRRFPSPPKTKRQSKNSTTKH